MGLDGDAYAILFRAAIRRKVDHAAGRSHVLVAQWTTDTRRPPSASAGPTHPAPLGAARVPADV